MRFLIGIILLLPLLHSGCTSFRTMSLGRMDNDSLFVDCFNRKAKGIPVKMKVPTHLMVSISEQQVLIRGKDGVRLQSFTPPQYEVESKLTYTDKVFLVDFVRPAGGSLTIGSESKNGITFDDDQYFKTIQAQVQEQTLKQIGTALDTVKKGFTDSGLLSSSGVVNAETNIPNLKFEKSIVACQRFDIARPHWEEEVNTFVEKYLGKCGTCPGAKPQAPIPVCPAPEASAEVKGRPRREQVSGVFLPNVPPALQILE